MVVVLVVMWHLYNTVLEPGMFGPWEDVVRAAKLSDAAKAVELEGVEECFVQNINNHVLYMEIWK